MNQTTVSKNVIMLYLTVVSVVIGIFVHFLHRGTPFLNDYLALQGIQSPVGFTYTLLNVSLVVTIVLLIVSIGIYKKDQEHTQLPLFLTLTLTAASITTIAGGDGLVEYHFSIFMVIAIIANFQNIKMILVSTVIFAVHHLAGYFLIPQLLCGTENYSFSLLMIHAVFLILTSGATILIIANATKRERTLTLETEEAEQQLRNVLLELEKDGGVLKNLSKDLQSNSEHVSQASLSMTRALKELEENAQEEAASMTQAISSNTNNITQFNDIHSKTEDAVHKAKNSLAKARDGKETIKQVTTQMEVITTTISSINELIDTLASQSSEITKLLNVIHSISEQTQLLALNASIEAARAGEHGKGFSVVASEIRNLATGTQNSAKEIDEVMETIQKQISTLATQMDTGMNEIYRGNQSIASTEEAFDMIVGTMSEVEQNVAMIARSTTYLMQETRESMQLFQSISEMNVDTVKNIGVVSQASEEQSDTIDSLNKAISSLNKITEDIYTLIIKLT